MVPSSTVTPSSGSVPFTPPSSTTFLSSRDCCAITYAKLSDCWNVGKAELALPATAQFFWDKFEIFNTRLRGILLPTPWVWIMATKLCHRDVNCCRSYAGNFSLRLTSERYTSLFHQESDPRAVPHFRYWNDIFCRP